MSKIDPFELPAEYKLELIQRQKDEQQKSAEMQYQLDLHDDYDLLSHPLNPPSLEVYGMRYESK